MRHFVLILSVLSLAMPAAHAARSAGIGAGSNVHPSASTIRQPVVQQSGRNVAINPQPLPPRASARPAINPQPLPPRNPPTDMR